MAQGVLPFQYESEKSHSPVTGSAGLALFLDMAVKAGLHQSIRRNVRARHNKSGWTDVQTILSLILLNIKGGDCVEDLAVMKADEGWRQLLLRAENTISTRRERRRQARTLRQEGRAAVPSQSAVFRYLAHFHDAGQEERRQFSAAKAFIPEPNAHLRGLSNVNADLVAFKQSCDPMSVATLDMDATIIETHKTQALYCYKHFKSYQPLNTYWAEHDVVLHSEFRDGNVPAGHEQRRVLWDALDLLPDGVEEVRLRSDTAGYQHDLLRACADGKHPRFGVIDFVIAADVSDEFKKAVREVPADQWRRLKRDEDGFEVPTAQEYADVPFFPKGSGHNKDRAPYRYIAIREVLEQRSLPGFEDTSQQRFPFQTIELERVHYKLFGLVTNMDWDDQGLIHWHRKRCGRSEQVHLVMKDDLAGGKLPSGLFGANAAWWWMMILSLNLVNIVKQTVLGVEWERKRLKAIRFHIVDIPGRVLFHARRLVVRLARNHPALGLLVDARRSIALLPNAPPLLP